jgi:hypothetical protein
MIKTLNILLLIVFLHIGTTKHSCSAVPNGQAITTLTIAEKSGTTTENYPLTFGHVFKKGDVTDTVTVIIVNQPENIVLNTQCDIKRRYTDGSIKHAVISVILPKLNAGEELQLILVTGGTNSITGEMSKDEIINTSVQSNISLNSLSGSGYSGNITANLLSTIIASNNINYWLKGSVCTEIIIKEQLNNSLNAAWEVRFYPKTTFGIRISNAIENVNSDYRGNINYSVDIQIGKTDKAPIYSKSSFTHYNMARWRKVFWLGPEPPEIEIRYNTRYLFDTGAVMNYDTSIEITDATISAGYAEWLASEHDIMDRGMINYYFPEVGGRPEIGVLPKWAVLYLLTMDNRLREILIGNGEMAGSCPIHYREADTTKNYAKPLSSKIVNINDRPQVITKYDSWAEGGIADNLEPPIGETTTPFTIDISHQGSFAFLPYLITGEYFFLEELYYWAGWNLSSLRYYPDIRNGSLGLTRDQVRGEAWGTRTIADAAAFAPDAHKERDYFLAKLNNNITVWMSERDRYPLNNWGIDYWPSGWGNIDTSQVKYPTSPWMEDFMLLTLSHIDELQLVDDLKLINDEIDDIPETDSVAEIIDWFSSFIINRFANPSFNPYNGAQYRFPIVKQDGTYIESWHEANNLFIDQPTSFPNEVSADNYRFIAKAALSTVIEKPDGYKAYLFLTKNLKEDNLAMMSIDPKWAIVPRPNLKPYIISIYDK